MSHNQGDVHYFIHTLATLPHISECSARAFAMSYTACVGRAPDMRTLDKPCFGTNHTNILEYKGL